MLLLPPPTCIARTIAIPLHVYCAIYDSPTRTPLVLAMHMHHTILVITISFSKLLAAADTRAHQPAHTQYSQVASAKRRNSGVPPRACVRVYTPVLVPRVRVNPRSSTG